MLATKIRTTIAVLAATLGVAAVVPAASQARPKKLGQPPLNCLALDGTLVNDGDTYVDFTSPYHAVTTTCHNGTICVTASSQSDNGNWFNYGTDCSSSPAAATIFTGGGRRHSPDTPAPSATSQQRPGKAS